MQKEPRLSTRLFCWLRGFVAWAGAIHIPLTGL
jgi:hypothetical protein